jgi:hypothetical protein
MIAPHILYIEHQATHTDERLAESYQHHRAPLMSRWLTEIDRLMIPIDHSRLKGSGRSYAKGGARVEMTGSKVPSMVTSYTEYRTRSLRPIRPIRQVIPGVDESLLDDHSATKLMIG